MKARSLSVGASELYRRWRKGAADRNSIRPGRVPESGLLERSVYLNLHVALLVWIILGAAVTIRTLVRPGNHTVFPIFAASAHHWWGNRSLYELYPGLDRYRYPPGFALFVTPFSVLGLTAGGIVWSWLSIAVFVAGLWQYVRDVIPSVWTRQRTALFLILSVLGALRGIWNAQSNALIAGFVLLGAAALSRAACGKQNKDKTDLPFSYRTDLPSGGGQSPFHSLHLDGWLAAGFLALAVCLKLTPLAPVLLLAVLWPRQLAWRLFAVMAGLMLLPFLTRPPEIVLDHYRDWIEHLLESGSIRWIGFRDGWTIWIVLQHLWNGAVGELSLREPLDSGWYRLVQLGSGMAVLGWCWWQYRRAQRWGWSPRWVIHVTLSIGMAWLMLFGPAVEHATYVFLAPPLLWALLESRAWPLGRGLIWASALLILVLGWGVVVRFLVPDWPILLTALPAGTALFALWLVGYARNCGTENSLSHTPTGEALSLVETRLVSGMANGRRQPAG